MVELVAQQRPRLLVLDPSGPGRGGHSLDCCSTSIRAASRAVSAPSRGGWCVDARDRDAALRLLVEAEARRGRLRAGSRPPWTGCSAGACACSSRRAATGSPSIRCCSRPRSTAEAGERACSMPAPARVPRPFVSPRASRRAAVVGLERDPGLAALARASVALNGLADRLAVLEGDLSASAGGAQRQASSTSVMSNPPYLDAARNTVPRGDRGGPMPHVEGVSVARWLDACLRRLRPGGRLALIHRADRLEALLGGAKRPRRRRRRHPALAEGRRGRPAA